jgi:hypothetical protein
MNTLIALAVAATVAAITPAVAHDYSSDFVCSVTDNTGNSLVYTFANNTGNADGSAGGTYDRDRLRQERPAGGLAGRLSADLVLGRQRSFRRDRVEGSARLADRARPGDARHAGPQWPSGRLGQLFARRRRGGVRPQQRSRRHAQRLTHKDHIVAKVRDGSNHHSNYKLLCAPCNMSKRAKDWNVWLAERCEA